MWPDVEKALVAHLAQTLGVRVSVATPPDLEQLPGFIRVTRGPGTDDGITDAPAIDVETFAPTRATARALAERARAAMHELSGRRAGAVLFDSVRTSSAPSWVDWGNPAVHRYVAVYAARFRRY
ncbi:hypothetical protein [Micrococcus luteus]|uniref:hypothetical protein n=1 Tax=Micrococcus luteus TaxID=1270 RepID=UPI0010095873|nr:hypothetical protein [Micrococcus luteus]QAV29778.1 hypothetical protein MT1254_11035 [Micrococcus luteus]